MVFFFASLITVGVDDRWDGETDAAIPGGGVTSRTDAFEGDDTIAGGRESRGVAPVGVADFFGSPTPRVIVSMRANNNPLSRVSNPGRIISIVAGVIPKNTSPSTDVNAATPSRATIEPHLDWRYANTSVSVDEGVILIRLGMGVRNEKISEKKSSSILKST
jgi:hypothetical protein